MIGQVIKNPFPIFIDNNGQALNDGFIFIGEAGLNPETSPVDTYWDDDFLYPAAQPIRTINGFPSRNGTPSAIVTQSTDYSILVKNKTEELIYSALSLTELSEVFKLVKGADVASDTILTVGDDGNYFDITGTTTIASIATKGLDSLIFLQFDESLTLSHNATGLVLPNDNDIVTQAGDEAILYEYATGDWRLISYLSNKNTSLGIMRWLKGADVASANALTVGDDGNYFDITGTTAITSIVTKDIGTSVKLQFDGILTITHHATDLILPRSENIITAAGDAAEFIEYDTGKWRLDNYERISGLSIYGGKMIQFVNVIDGSVATGSTIIPADDSIPSNTEGDEYMTLAITPTDANNSLVVQVVVNIAHSAAGVWLTAALFQDTATDAVAVATHFQDTAQGGVNLSFLYKKTTSVTSLTTFKVRCGGEDAGVLTFNGSNSSRMYGGALASSITITEEI